jgi:hypothetical protein
MAKVLPEYLRNWTMRKVQALGVEVLPKRELVSVQLQEGGPLPFAPGVLVSGCFTAARVLDGKVALATSQGDTVVADYVLVAVGIEPNTQLPQAASLELDPVRGTMHGPTKNVSGWGGGEGGASAGPMPSPC